MNPRTVTSLGTLSVYMIAITVLNLVQCLGRYLGIIGQDLNVSKSNRLHVDIFRLFFISLRYIL